MKCGSMVGGLLVLNLLAGVWVRGQSQPPKYHAAKATSAGSVGYPMNAKEPGFVTVDVSVGANGSVQGVSVVRDVPPFTGALQSAVSNWQFAAATVAGQAAPGVVRVNAAFNPYNPSGVGLPGASLQPGSGSAGGDFQPAGLQSASYANYPPNTVESGTVALLVHVSAGGQVGKVRILHGKGVLAEPATEAAKNWTFTAASYKGKAVDSDVVVVFVFAAPQAGTR